MTVHHCPSYPCPLCHPHGVTYQLPPTPTFHPPGCICPPTSEKTCQAPLCPRRGVSIGAGTRISQS
jgi:hypothetical protein